MAGVRLYLVAELVIPEGGGHQGFEALAESEFAVIPEASLQACLKTSKLFIAYLEGFVAVSPHRRAGGTADPRATGFVEEVSAAGPQHS